MNTVAAMPRHLEPMKATAGALPTDDDDWAFEIKWDGVRAIAYIEDARLHLESRNLLDITPRYPELFDTPRSLASRRVVLDGEVVAFDADGAPSFGLLQQRMHLTNPTELRSRRQSVPVAYLVFDVLWLDGESLVARPYAERREVLEGLTMDGAWNCPTSHVGDGESLRQATLARGLEGVVAKRLSSPYEPGRRSKAWLKVKNQRRQEVVVGGWLPGAGNRTGRIGALLVGYYDGKDLRYAGRVGTGFTDATLRELGATLASIERATPAFVDPPRERSARWVEPVLVGEVEFTEWTTAGTMRHPSYKGLRDDKAAAEVVREPDLRKH